MKVTRNIELQNMFSNIINKIEKTLRVSVGVLVIGLVVVTIIGVIFRYVFKSPIVGIEELCRFLMVWMVFFGGAIALKKGTHISFRNDDDIKLNKNELLLKLILSSTILIFLFFISIYSILMSRNLGSLSSPGLGIPLVIYFLGPIIGFIISFIFSIENFIVYKSKYVNFINMKEPKQ